MRRRSSWRRAARLGALLRSRIGRADRACGAACSGGARDAAHRGQVALRRADAGGRGERRAPVRDHVEIRARIAGRRRDDRAAAAAGAERADGGGGGRRATHHGARSVGAVAARRAVQAARLRAQRVVDSLLVGARCLLACVVSVLWRCRLWFLRRVCVVCARAIRVGDAWRTNRAGARDARSASGQRRRRSSGSVLVDDVRASRRSRRPAVARSAPIVVLSHSDLVEFIRKYDVDYEVCRMRRLVIVVQPVARRGDNATVLCRAARSTLRSRLASRRATPVRRRACAWRERRIKRRARAQQ